MTICRATYGETCQYKPNGACRNCGTDPAVDMWTQAFEQATGRHLSEPEPDRRSTAAIDAEDRLEAIAEDRAWEGRWGGTDYDADWAANRYEQFVLGEN